MKFLLDSVIVIDHLNGIILATNWIARHHKQSYLSTITRAEVLVGVEEQDLDTITLFLNQFAILPLVSEDADLAAQLRRQYRWKLPDAFQAALAKRHDLLLVTRNTKDFPKSCPFVITPYLMSH